MKRASTKAGRTLAAYATLSYLALAANVAGYLRAAPPATGSPPPSPPRRA